MGHPVGSFSLTNIELTSSVVLFLVDDPAVAQLHCDAVGVEADLVAQIRHRVNNRPSHDKHDNQGLIYLISHLLQGVPKSFTHSMFRHD